MTKPHFEKAPQILINDTEKAPVSLLGGPFPTQGSLCLVGQKKQRGWRATLKAVARLSL